MVHEDSILSCRIQIAMCLHVNIDYACYMLYYSCSWKEVKLGSVKAEKSPWFMLESLTTHNVEV